MTLSTKYFLKYNTVGISGQSGWLSNLIPIHQGLTNTAFTITDIIGVVQHLFLSLYSTGGERQVSTCGEKIRCHNKTFVSSPSRYWKVTCRPLWHTQLFKLQPVIAVRLGTGVTVLLTTQAPASYCCMPPHRCCSTYEYSICSSPFFYSH